jgi:hypothetical protein
MVPAANIKPAAPREHLESDIEALARRNTIFKPMPALKAHPANQPQPEIKKPAAR